MIRHSEFVAHSIMVVTSWYCLRNYEHLIQPFVANHRCIIEIGCIGCQGDVVASTTDFILAPTAVAQTVCKRQRRHCF